MPVVVEPVVVPVPATIVPAEVRNRKQDSPITNYILSNKKAPCKYYEMQRAKIQKARAKAQSPKDLRRYLRAGSGAVTIPEAAEPVEVPVPATSAPAEAAGTQRTNREAIDGAPKENALVLPLLRNQFRMLEQKVKDIGVEHGLVHQLLAEFIALDVLAVLLVLGEMKSNLCRIPLQLTLLLVALQLPTFGQEGVGIAVDDVFNHDDLCQAFQNILELSEPRKRPQLGDFVWCKASLLKSISQLVHLVDGIQCGHCPLLSRTCF